jgi:hypothetical protein
MKRIDNGSLPIFRTAKTDSLSVFIPRQFVWEGISTGHEEKYYQLKDQRYLGEESFNDRIEIEEKDPENWVYDISLGAISQG